MEFDDIDLPDEETEASEEGQTDSITVDSIPGKFDKLLGENSRKFKLSGMFKECFLG